MKRLSIFLCSLLLAAGMLSACSQSNTNTNETPSAPQTNTEQAKPPAPVEEPYEPALLTGLKKGPDYPEGQRFTAVMVNNISQTSHQQARPQAGLSAADVLVEIKVEGGITRFMALFENYKTMPRVGPVRSARDQFFQLILPFHPLYIHVGESVVQTEFKNNYGYKDFDLNGDVLSSLGHRDKEFRSRGVAVEHTYVTSGEEIANTIDKYGYESTIRPYKSTLFDFVHYDKAPRTLTGSAANEIDIVHSKNYKTYFQWDDTQQKYLMSQYSSAARAVKPSIDANNQEQLKFDNVIVLFTDIHTYPGHEAKDLQKVDYAFGGVGYYFSGGRSEEVRWQKGAADQVLRIVYNDENNTNVKINPGKTYLAVVDLDEASNFVYRAPAPVETTDPSASVSDSTTQ